MTNDQGFGTQIASAHGQRLLNRDGSFTVRRRGLGLRAFVSLYHSLLTMRWPVFLLLLLGLFIGINVIFALAYLACGPGAIEGPESGFAAAFYLSVHTLSSVGYGHLRPVGTAANLVATFESFTSLLIYALSTGLIFARFSRPTPDVAFSENALVAPYRGGLGLMIRIANRRRAELVDLNVRIIASHRAGESGREFVELALERAHISFFPLSWTLVHALDENSPLRGWTEDEAHARDLELLVMMTGMDEDESKSINVRTSYKATELIWGARFADIFDRGPAGNPEAIDVGRVGAYEPV
ncbi:MAG: ion channel [Planctomycetota bacterium]|jgi:inward rectifier potassium channel